MLSGIVAEPLDLFDHLAAMGARVVADDLAGGARRLYPAEGARRPVRAARRAACWAARPIPPGATPSPPGRSGSRSRWRRAAPGAWSSTTPSSASRSCSTCPSSAATWRRPAIPLLHVEVELSGSLSQQTLTRLEAFVETLR